MVKLPRRTFLHLTAGAAVLPAVSRVAWANYPSRPITMVVGYPAGGPTDALARVLAEQIKGTLGQPVVIENRPGAQGTMSAVSVVNAAPDGHTLLVTPNAVVTLNPHLQKNFPFRPLNAFDGMRDAAQDIKERRGKRLVIAAEPFHLHALVPAAIEQMGRGSDFKCAVDICIRGLGLWVSRSNVDLAVVALPFTQTDMRQIIFAEVDLVVALPKGHALASRRTITMKDLAAEPFIALRPTT